MFSIWDNLTKITTSFYFVHCREKRFWTIASLCAIPRCASVHLLPTSYSFRANVMMREGMERNIFVCRECGKQEFWDKFQRHAAIVCETCPNLLNHVIGFSDLVDLWVIKIRTPMILCARCTSRWTRNADRTANTCERFVHSIVKIPRVCDYQTLQTYYLINSRGAQRYVGFFLDSDWLGRQTPSHGRLLYGGLIDHWISLSLQALQILSHWGLRLAPSMLRVSWCFNVHFLANNLRNSNPNQFAPAFWTLLEEL